VIKVLVTVACGAVLLIAQPAFSQSAPDTDGDGFSDGAEIHMGTSPTSRCAPEGQKWIDAWPPDLYHDDYVDGTDITLMAGFYNRPAGAPYGYSGLVRYDLNEPLGNGWIDGTDITILAGYFNKHC